MSNARLCFSATITLTLYLVTGCTSADTRAANNAAQAQADYDQGRFNEASRAIRKALAVRDNNLDYWLLKAHIDLKKDDLKSAFGDYEYVIQLDHGNFEALQTLCQLGITAGPRERVDSYADQLLVLAPDSLPALTAKGNVALSTGDTDNAQALADRVLTLDQNYLPALSLKAGILIAHEKFADAAALIEKTSAGSANTVGRLKVLQGLYLRALDRPSYVRTVQQLAKAAPDDIDLQLSYADTLYQDGQNDMARSVVRQVLARNPASLRAAAAGLMLWMKAGPQALDASRIVADAADLPILSKADYAQFANETGRPDLALAILRGSDRGQATTMNSNAKAAFAYALGLTGHRPEAMAQLNAILAGDANQPWALLARARLLAAVHDYQHAVRDARLLVANGRDDPTAYLALADILRASGSADLSLSALREGMRAIPDATRLADRLAAALSANGDTVQAADVARDLVRKAPLDPRAQHLLQTYGGGARVNPDN